MWGREKLTNELLMILKQPFFNDRHAAEWSHTVALTFLNLRLLWPIRKSESLLRCAQTFDQNSVYQTSRRWSSCFFMFSLKHFHLMTVVEVDSPEHHYIWHQLSFTSFLLLTSDIRKFSGLIIIHCTVVQWLAPSPHSDWCLSVWTFYPYAF